MAGTWEARRPGPAEAQPPPRVGRFELGRPLAEGGHGVLYLARDADGVEAVVKVAGPHGSDARLRREGEALALLRVPGIVPLVDRGELDGRPYVVLGRVAGESLAARTRQGAISSREAARLVSEAARVIARAHALGVLHRDLTPSNLLVDAGGRIVIVDFGLARIAGRQEEELTATGQSLGTPGLRAPELLRGGPTDERTDVFGLGATLHSLVAGEPPYWPEERLLAGSPPAPLPAPEALVSVVARAIDPDPRWRYPDAAALADDLERFLRGSLVRAPGRFARWARRSARRLLVLAALAIALVPAALAARQRREDLGERRGLEAARHLELARAALAARWHADAAVLAAASLENLETPEAWQVLCDAVTAPASTPVEVSSRPAHALAVDGRRLWIGRGSVVTCEEDRAPVIEGPGEVVALAAESGLLAAAWLGPAGALEVRLLDGSGGAIARVATSCRGSPVPLAIDPGSRSVFAGWLAPDGTGRIAVARGDVVRSRAAHASSVVSLALSLDGRVLLSGGGDRRARLWDTTTLEAAGADEEHADSVHGVGFLGSTRVSASRDGEIRFVGETGRRSHRVPAFAAETLACLASHVVVGGHDASLRILSEQGLHAVVETGDVVSALAADGHRAVWSRSTGVYAATLDKERRHEHGSAVHALAWGPDGRLATSSGDRRIHVIARERRTVLARPRAKAHAVAWSRDGTLLATGGEDGEVTVRETTTGSVRTRASVPMVLGLAFSPDTLSVACGSNEGAAFVVALGDGSVHRLASAAPSSAPRFQWVHSVAYTPDGALVTGETGAFIQILEPGSVEPRRVRVRSMAARCVAASPDGSLVAAGGDAGVEVIDRRSGELVASLRDPLDRSPALAVAFDPSGRHVAVVLESGRISTAPARGGGTPRSLPGAGTRILAAALTRDLSRVALAAATPLRETDGGHLESAPPGAGRWLVVDQRVDLDVLVGTPAEVRERIERRTGAVLGVARARWFGR